MITSGKVGQTYTRIDKKSRNTRKGLSSYKSKSKWHWTSWDNLLSILESSIKWVNGLPFLEHNIMSHILLLFVWNVPTCFLNSGMLVYPSTLIKYVFQGSFLLSVRGDWIQGGVGAYIPWGAMTPNENVNQVRLILHWWLHNWKITWHGFWKGAHWVAESLENDAIIIGTL